MPVARREDGRLVSKYVPLPKPAGTRQELRVILARHGMEAFFSDIWFNADRLLVGIMPDRPRLADDYRSLAQIARLAKVGSDTLAIEEKISHLSGIAWTFLWLAVPDELGKRRAKQPSINEVLADRHWLALAARAAQQEMRKTFRKDVGGRNVSTRWRGYGDPNKYFITRLMDLWVAVHGLESLTKTVASTSAITCYGFVDAVVGWATGRRIGREKPFKHIVDKRRRSGEISLTPL